MSTAATAVVIGIAAVLLHRQMARLNTRAASAVLGRDPGPRYERSLQFAFRIGGAIVATVAALRLAGVSVPMLP